VGIGKGSIPTSSSTLSSTSSDLPEGASPGGIDRVDDKDPESGNGLDESGGCRRRGLAVSKCTGRGWLVDTLFNPHYAARLPKPPLPHPEYTRKVASGPKDDFVQLLRRQLAGLVFGRCEDEVIVRTFLYAANEGIAFRDDGGGARLPPARRVASGPVMRHRSFRRRRSGRVLNRRLHQF